MPTMTASTMTLTPEATILPSTFLGEKGGLIEEREGNEDEAGERRQLELDQRDEELHGENEEGDQHQQPGDHQHGDLDEVGEEAGEARPSSLAASSSG